MAVVLENTGPSHCFVSLRQTQDRSVSGERFDVISGIPLVPGGHVVKNTDGAYMQFLELYCTDGGPSEVRMQVSSQRRWELLGFDKVADATFYPTQLWQVKPVPQAPSI